MTTTPLLKPIYKRGDVVLVLFPNSGLLTDSVVMTDNLATITNQAIERVIGMLPMTQVEAALRYTLSL